LNPVEELRQLRDLMQKHCFKYGDFTLASGLTSKYYYDGKKVTLRPRSAEIIGRLLVRILREVGAEAVGGLAIGADPIAEAVALASIESGYEIPAFIVRPDPKKHGTREQVAQAFSDEGGELLGPGRRVAVVDDVITTGGSVDKAISVVKALGGEVVAVVVLVERHEGGGQELRDKGYNFISLLHTDEEGNLSIDEGLLQRLGSMPVGRVLR